MLLSVKDLSVDLQTSLGLARAVRGISFDLQRGGTIGIVGESGCGKSITALAIMGLLPDSAHAKGRIEFDGRDLLSLGEKERCRIRGNRIAMIFQEPMTSLNPVHRIGRQIAEPLRLHRGLKGGNARDEVLRLLDRVGLPDPARRINAYPHQMSGGQRQRIMIAIALSCRPDILLADEPTTALDVTIQGQILALINELVEETNMGLILISHDLGVIDETADNIAVMYGGTIVEQGSTDSLFRNLMHPYSQGLMAAIPKLGEKRLGTLPTISGIVPELVDFPNGCAFADRCSMATGICWQDVPRMELIGVDHKSACHHQHSAQT